MPDTDRFLEKARNALRESKYVDFKEKFDPNEDGEWIELIKDIRRAREHQRRRRRDRREERWIIGGLEPRAGPRR